MKRSGINGLSEKYLIFALLGILAGCQSKAPAPQPEIVQPLALPVAVEQPRFVAESGLSSEERLRKAIDLLALGQAGQAEVELQAYETEVEDSKVASNLLRQIQAPIDDLYPPDFTEVVLTDGESLSTIAQRYLGDALQFYGLARFNQIGEPDKTRVGQVIKVPLTEKAKIVLARPPEKLEDAVRKDALVDMETPAEQNGFQDVSDIEKPDQSPLLIDENTGATGMPRTLSGGEGETTSSESLTGGDIKIQQFLAEKNYPAAIAEFEKLSSQDGFDQVILTGITDAYHREASQAFRRQDLNVAIELWEKVLVLDPGHAHANNSLLQAQELKQKLERLE